MQFTLLVLTLRRYWGNGEMSGCRWAQSGWFPSRLWAAAAATLTAMQRDTFGGVLGLSAAVNYHPLLDAAAAGFCNCVSLNEKLPLMPQDREVKLGKKIERERERRGNGWRRETAAPRKMLNFDCWAPMFWNFAANKAHLIESWVERGWEAETKRERLHL